MHHIHVQGGAQVAPRLCFNNACGRDPQPHGFSYSSRGGLATSWLYRLQLAVRPSAGCTMAATPCVRVHLPSTPCGRALRATAVTQ